MNTRRRLTAMAIVATVAIAGCGGDDEPESLDTLPDLTGQPATATSGSTATLSTSEVGGTAPATSATGSTTAAQTGPTGPLGDPAVTFADGVGGEGLVKIVQRPGGRKYVVAQRGQVLVLSDDNATSPVLDLQAEVSTGNEQGLLGLAFHPDLPLAYVNYTDTSGDTVIAEYAVTATGSLDPASQREVMAVDQPYDNHNGGNLVFGPDKYLYIGFGDGGSADDPQRNALSLSTPLGKMLRIDPVVADGQDGFNTPADNPFVGTSGALAEIWSSGLRNPWRFSFDQATGDLWIADVGQGRVEEIDVAGATGGFSAGKAVNFGWSAFEGNDRFNEDQSEKGHTPPRYTYTHEEGRCSVTGGVAYRGSAIPELRGYYVFADYCSGELWALDFEGEGDGEIVELGSVASPVSIDQVGDDLYVVSQADGAQLVERAS